MPNLKNWPCVFRGKFIREEIDPRVQAAFQDRWPGKKIPFGELRRLFRERHCRTLNPYGSDTCPYTEEDCALAFLRDVKTSLEYSGKSLGYYRAVCLSSGARRADEKPLSRDVGRTHGADPTTRLDPSTVAAREGSEDGLRRRLSRPVRIGDLFGGPDERARHPGVRANGEEGEQR